MSPTCRVTGVARNTVTKLLIDLGQACSEYQDAALSNLACNIIELDEIWSFCYSKQKNVPEDFKGTYGYGDVWTWTAIDAETKLIALVELVDDFISRAEPASAGRFPRSRARGWDLLISRGEPYEALRLRTDGRIWVPGSRNDWTEAREFDRTFTDGELDELAASMAGVLIRSEG